MRPWNRRWMFLPFLFALPLSGIGCAEITESVEVVGEISSMLSGAETVVGVQSGTAGKQLYVVIVNSTYADSSEVVRQQVARRIAELLRDRHTQYEKVDAVRVSFETKSERKVGIATVTKTDGHGSYVFPVKVLGPSKSSVDVSAQRRRTGSQGTRTAQVAPASSRA